MNNWQILKEGDKIEILNDFFIVDSFENSKKYRKIKLKTKDPDIFLAEIHYYDEEHIIFLLKRKIDIKINGRGFTHNNFNYQIINEEKEEVFTNSKWIKRIVFDVNKVDEKNYLDYRRKIVCDKKDHFVFYNYELIRLEEIEFNPEEKFESYSEPITKRFKIKIKEKI